MGRIGYLSEWLREVVLGLAAFVGGRSINALSEARKERLAMRDAMTRLALAVESISTDLHEIKADVREQVGLLREDLNRQIAEVKASDYEYQIKNDRRMHAMEWRIDGINSRVDSIAANGCPAINRDRMPMGDDDT